MTSIKDLTTDMRNVEVEGIILGKGEVRNVTLKDGSTKNVCDAVIGDNTGEISLSLWDQNTNFAVGDRVKVGNAYVGSYQGKNKLTTGKFGTIAKLG